MRRKASPFMVGRMSMKRELSIDLGETYEIH